MDADFLKLAGDAAEGAQTWEYGSPLDKLPEGKSFSDKFQKRFGVAILSYARSAMTLPGPPSMRCRRPIRSIRRYTGRC